MSAEFNKAAKRFQSALVEMLGIDYVSALSIVTGSFVSLTLEVMRRNGQDHDCEVRIDGGKNRDVTIHATKGTT